MISNALKSIRVFNKISQSELSRKLDVSNSYISEIESGKKNVSIDIIKKYEEFFNIPASSIFELSEKMDNKKALPKHKRLIVDIINWATEDK